MAKLKQTDSLLLAYISAAVIYTVVPPLSRLPIRVVNSTDGPIKREREKKSLRDGPLHARSKEIMFDEHVVSRNADTSMGLLLAKHLRIISEAIV